MRVRQMTVAGTFYEESKGSCERSIERCIGGYSPPADIGRALGGVVPHAGWIYSGSVAAKVYVTLKEFARPETIVLFGAVHHWGVSRPSVDGNEAWATPLGDLPVDTELMDVLLETANGEIVRREDAHGGEHSIEVQLPFVKKLFPDARILPIAVPPARNAIWAGKRAAEAIIKSGKRVAVVLTTDLTHYGMNYHDCSHGPLPEALSWMKSNDMRMVKLIEQLRAERVLLEVAENSNACGPGAVAAGVAAAREMGAVGARLLQYANSAEVAGDTSVQSAVGYAGLVFCPAT